MLSAESVLIIGSICGNALVQTRLFPYKKLNCNRICVCFHKLARFLLFTKAGGIQLWKNTI